MSESHLPDDLAAWPRDPYRLLGIALGTPARVAKQAYRALIRKYKPEHAPEAFRLIRDAWETIERLSLPATEEDDNREPAPVSTDPPAPTFEAPTPDPDRWNQVIAGSIPVEEAYRGLVEQVDRGSRVEDDFLQLAWLLTTCPEVDPGNDPGGWLILGWLACGSSAPRVGEWLRRQADADPEWATGATVGVLLARPMPIEATTRVATWRWRAARRLGRWDEIKADVATLRAWVLGRAIEGWPALLLLAAENLAWVNDPARILRIAYREEAEEVAHDHALDLDDPLLNLEYANAVANGLDELVWTQVADGLVPPCSATTGTARGRVATGRSSASPAAPRAGTSSPSARSTRGSNSLPPCSGCSGSFSAATGRSARPTRRRFMPSVGSSWAARCFPTRGSGSSYWTIASPSGWPPRSWLARSKIAPP